MIQKVTCPNCDEEFLEEGLKTILKSYEEKIKRTTKKVKKK